MTDGFYRRPNTIKSIVATVAIAALVFVSYTVNENPLTVFECEFTPIPAHRFVSTTAYLFDAIGVKTSPVVAKRDVVDNVDVVTVLWCIRTATADNNTAIRASAAQPLRHPCRPVGGGRVWVVSGDFDMTASRAAHCGEIDVLAVPGAAVIPGPLAPPVQLIPLPIRCRWQ